MKFVVLAIYLLIIIGCGQRIDDVDVFIPENKYLSQFSSDNGDHCIIKYHMRGCFSSWNYEFTVFDDIIRIKVDRGYNSLKDFILDILKSKTDTDILNSHIQWGRTENGRGASTNHHEYTIQWVVGGKVVQQEYYLVHSSEIPYSMPIWQYVDGLTRKLKLSP